MKKILILIALILLVSLFFVKENNYIIPNEAIRFRIVANSNSVYDQYIKEEVKKNTEMQLLKISTASNSIEESRKNIISELPGIKLQVKNVLDANYYDKGFNVNFGSNYFPEKVYRNVKYPAGEYESLVITIGDGKGDNWWCVLFPPICFIETDETDEVEYEFMIKDLFSKYINK